MGWRPESRPPKLQSKSSNPRTPFAVDFLVVTSSTRLLGEATMRALGFVVCALFLLSALAWCDEQQHHHQLTASEVGSVHFSTSCSRDVEADFNRAVALLH